MQGFLSQLDNVLFRFREDFGLDPFHARVRFYQELLSHRCMDGFLQAAEYVQEFLRAIFHNAGAVRERKQRLEALLPELLKYVLKSLCCEIQRRE